MFYSGFCFLVSSFLSRFFLIFVWFLIFVSVSGCATAPPISNDDKFLIKMSGNPDKPKSIFIFLDGTANDELSGTNVWRLFEKVKEHKNQQTVGLYVPGVGRVTDPLEDDPIFPILGDGLGMGMKARILMGYSFIAKNYSPGDEIFIFGFSRGAHQARALAGLISYAGIPAGLKDGEEHEGKLRRILGLLEDVRDEEMLAQWEAWVPGQKPLLAQLIKGDDGVNIDMQGAEVKLLGVWDTVPGSSFKGYGACKEKIGFYKKYFHRILFMVSRGERYKSGSYPPIRNIAHAVSADENRSKFAPLFLCNAINGDYTKLDELWFPGAHADVGGGYGDNGLPDLSLGWMIGVLQKNYVFASRPDKVEGDPKGLAHWSFGDEPGNTGSDCKGRLDSEDRQPPLGYNPDPSIGVRKDGGPVPIIVDVDKVAKKMMRDYPVMCPGFGR